MDCPYLSLPYLKCTGCSSCMNICPTDAITMAPITKEGLDKGFAYPKIDASKCISCGKCVKHCPVINTDFSNKAEPDSYSSYCDPYREQCSSGGAYGALATWFVRNGGVAVGAKMDEDLNLSEVIVDTEKDLGPLFKSKYVQSEVGLVYRDIKAILEKGTDVLFCSTPCQVAGLKSYLGKTYENLYLVDLVCHGVTSPELLKRTFKEEYPNDRVVSLDFRSKKKEGWGHLAMEVNFENGESKYMDRRKSPFYDYFLSNNCLRRSCYHCPYATLPRQGDATIFDHWNAVDEKKVDKKGLNALLINNEKGEDLMGKLIDMGSVIDPYPLEKLVERHVNLSRPSAKKPGFKRFHRYSTDRPLKDAFAGSNIDAEVGLTVMVSHNFGNNLTNYSLFNAIRKLGHTVAMIPREKMDPALMFRKSPYGTADVYRGNPADTNEFCKMFLLGSDQVFVKHNIVSDNMFPLMPWADPYKYKATFSSSFGHDFFKLPSDVMVKVKPYMQGFDSVSLRESSGPKIMKDVFDVDAIHISDPVFLSSGEDYRKIAKNFRKKIPKDPYIAVYTLAPSDEAIAQIKEVSEKLGIPNIVGIQASAKKDIVDGSIRIIKKGTVEEFLYLIDHSSMFLTDSFHGMCFAMILNKQFYLLKGAEIRTPARIDSLLETYGLENRKLSKAETLEEIDYSVIQPLIDRESEKAYEHLKHIIEDGLSSNKQPSETELLARNVEELENTVELQNRVIERLCLSEDGPSLEDCMELGNAELLLKYAFDLVAKDAEGNMDSIFACYEKVLDISGKNIVSIGKSVSKTDSKAYRFEVIRLVKSQAELGNRHAARVLGKYSS